jgi:hypothetical protein
MSHKTITSFCTVFTSDHNYITKQCMCINDKKRAVNLILIYFHPYCYIFSDVLSFCLRTEIQEKAISIWQWIVCAVLHCQYAAVWLWAGSVLRCTPCTKLCHWIPSDRWGMLTVDILTYTLHRSGVLINASSCLQMLVGGIRCIWH